MSIEHRAKTAELLGLPVEPLEQLRVGWSASDIATTWPMRDATGNVIGVRLRCPTTNNKWTATGSTAGLFYAADLLSQKPDRLYISSRVTLTPLRYSHSDCL